MTSFRISGPAQRDIRTFLDSSRSRFGDFAADRYYSLFLKALSLIREDPKYCSLRAFDGVPKSLSAFHLKSVSQGKPPSVKSPRHLIIFRWDAHRIDILRVIHERRDRKAMLR